MGSGPFGATTQKAVAPVQPTVNQNQDQNNQNPSAKFYSPTNPAFQQSVLAPTPMPTMSPFEQGLMAPGSIGTPTGIGLNGSLMNPSALQNNMPAAPGSSIMTGALGNSLGNVGSYTSGITAGVLPQSVIDQASAAIRTPIAGNTLSTGANSQIADLARGGQSMANVNMQRGAAQTQAAMNMARQNAQANAGLGWSNFLANQDNSQTRLMNSYLQPITGSLLQSLVG